MHYRERRYPHCGSTNGLYTLNSYYNVIERYDFNGDFKSESFYRAAHKSGRMMYCSACDKFVCKLTDFEKLYPKEAADET